MQNQNRKLVWWLFGANALFLLLIALEVTIAESIGKNDSELIILILITVFIYLIILVIKFVIQYQRYVKKCKSKELEKANKESTEK